MKVPLLDLKAQYNSIRSEIEPVVREVMESQQFILGPQVKSCEAALAAYCGCGHAVTVSSGSDALILALMAERIGLGHEVITSPYTFFATAGAIARVGATPVFVDIDPVTFNIDPARIEQAITPRTRAIMPVHLYGQTADMELLNAIARKHNLIVIEDACQAIGAECNGRRAGTLGDYGCFSFFPSKNLGCFGDGGFVTTGDSKRAEHLSIMRVHGSHPKYYHKFIGGNFRFDTIQAAVVMVKLKHLDAWTEGRQRNARVYNQLLSETGLEARGLVKRPQAVTTRHVYNQYVLRAERRDELRAYLQSADIGTEVYYPVPLHAQECFAYLGYKPGDFRESEKAAAETLALPIYPELSQQQLAYVVEKIAAFYMQR